MTAARVLMFLLFGTDSRSGILFMLLFIAGLYRIFTKSGVKGYLAFIPWVREYQLSLCAGREPDGRFYAFSSFLANCFSVSSLLKA